jgi:hypothetical protein
MDCLGPRQARSLRCAVVTTGCFASATATGSTRPVSQIAATTVTLDGQLVSLALPSATNHGLCYGSEIATGVTGSNYADTDATGDVSGRHYR